MLRHVGRNARRPPSCPPCAPPRPQFHRPRSRRRQGLTDDVQEGVQPVVRRIGPVFRDLDLEVHPEADIVLGVAPCADLGGARPGGVRVIQKAEDLALAERRCPQTASEQGAGRLSIHGGAYAEMSHLPFTCAVARAPGGGGDRAAVGGPTHQHWPVRLGGYGNYAAVPWGLRLLADAAQGLRRMVLPVRVAERCLECRRRGGRAT